MGGSTLAASLADVAALAAAMFAVFVLPGALLLSAARARVASAESLAHAFAASLVLLTAAFSACLALSTSVSAAPAALVVVTLAACAAARGLVAPCSPPPVRDVSGHPGLLSRATLVVLVVAAVAAAVAFAPVGSVDRWWYLAYVRSWLEAPVLDLAEPFLGTGRPFARFGVHPWLFGLSVCSWLSGLDPLVVYERGAPALVVLASVSASFALLRRLFAEEALVCLGVIATMMLWSGGLIPVLARAGEDKVLAVAALLPLAIAAFLGVLRAPERGRRPALLLLALSAAATAAVHALDYAFALVVLVPAAAAIALLQPRSRRALAAAAVVLALVAIAPAATGLVVRERLGEIGAELAADDHPVVRVHEARERLVELPFGGYAVRPRLLLHPLGLLALGGAVLLARRGSRVAATREAAVVLGVATLLPLAIAFVPPLPSWMGALIPPWMVYRVLWLLPLAPLAAIAALVLTRRLRQPESWATVLLVVLGLPGLLGGAGTRLSEARGRLAAPRSAEFDALVTALRALPGDALVAAPPALAERLPALAARHVVAALDRSTVVFSGSRALGEARLRARAALLAGDAEAVPLAREAGVVATHAVFDPASGVQPRCGLELLRGRRVALCELRPEAAFVPPSRMEPASAADADGVVAEGRCNPASGSIAPWSAAPPASTCSIQLPATWRGREGLALRIATRTGRAVDELRVVVTAGSSSLAGVARARGNATTTFRLPPVEADELEVRVTSAFLPVLRLGGVAVVER